MRNTIKLAALGACALAASSTAALAGSELPIGITTGLSVGMPLPKASTIPQSAATGHREPGTTSCRLS